MASGEGVYDLWGAGVVMPARTEATNVRNGAINEDFWFGLTLGAISAVGIVGLLIAIFGGENGGKLRTCTKTHNVYQCEMVAVPKIGEK